MMQMYVQQIWPGVSVNYDLHREQFSITFCSRDHCKFDLESEQLHLHVVDADSTSLKECKR